MFGKTWVFGSIISAVALVTTAAGPAGADDRRWGIGRPQWQPPAHAGGWSGHDRGGDRDRDWRGRSEWGHDRYAWWRRDHDNRRWYRNDGWERYRRHDSWRPHQQRRWWD